MDANERLDGKVAKARARQATPPLPGLGCTHEHMVVVQLYEPSGAWEWHDACQDCTHVDPQTLTEWEAIRRTMERAERRPRKPGNAGLGVPCHAIGCDQEATVHHHVGHVADVGQTVADELGTVPYCERHHRMAHTPARRRSA